MLSTTIPLRKNLVRFFLSLSLYAVFSTIALAQDNYVISTDNDAKYINIPNYGDFLTRGNAYTVECLFKLDNLPEINSWQAIFGSGDFFNPNFVTCAKPIVMINRAASTGTYFAFIPTERKNNNFGQLPVLPISYELETGIWYHVAFVYNGDREFYFYVNGRRVGHATKTHYSNSCSFFNNTMNIGGLDISGSNYYHLDGSVDEFRVWRKAKTETEIQAQMYRHLSGNETDLDLYYDFDDAATLVYNPNAVTDVSGNGNNGIARGFTLLDWTASDNFSCFTGAVDNDFSRSDNWYNYQINPTNVGIDAATSITNDLSLHNISIGHNGSLTVTNKSTLTIDSYIHAQGELLLEENTSLVQLDNNIINQYPVKVQRTGNTNEFSYSYWSFPAVKNINFSYGTPPSSAPYATEPTVTKTLLSATDVFDFGNIAGQRDPYWLFLLTGTQGGFGNGTDNVFWTQINQSVGIEPGFGFTLKGPLGSDPSHGKATMNGVPNNGNISVPLHYVDNNSYLIGNPYPSAISADEFINRNNATITGTLYFWEQWEGDSHNYDEYIGGYATYTKLGTVTTKNLARSINDSSDDGNTLPDGFISSGQGFVIETRTNNSGNIVFDNDMRIGGNNSQFYRQAVASGAGTNDNKKCWINFYNDEGDFDQILIGTDANATSGVDYGLDGKFTAFKPVYAYTIIEEEKYTINAVQTLGRPIPLGLATDKNIQHTIALSRQEGLEDYLIILKDKLTNTTYNLKEATHSFSMDIGDFNDRFEIIIRRGSDRNTQTNEIPIIALPEVQLRPNTNGIAVVTEKTITSIQIADLSGRIVYTNRTQTNFIHQKFDRGFYFITMQDTEGNTIQKKVFLN